MAEAASLFLRFGGVGSSGDKPATTPSDQRDQRDRREDAINRKTKRPKRPRDQREDAINSCPRPRLVPRSQGPMVSNCRRPWLASLSQKLIITEKYFAIWKILLNFEDAKLRINKRRTQT